MRIERMGLFSSNHRIFPRYWLIRVREWWYHKIPFCIFIFVLTANAENFSDFSTRLVALILAVSAVGNYGNAVNELFDRDEDAKAGKKNIATLYGATRIWSVAIISAIFSIAVSAWAGGRIAAILTICAILLPTIYSAPPIRLKERKLLGALADALAAHVYPAMLAVYLATLGRSGALEIILFSAALLWSFMAGLRGILTHQVDTADRDTSAGLVTIAHDLGELTIARLVLLVILPLEIVGLATLCVAAPVGITFSVLGAVFVWAEWARLLTGQKIANIEPGHLSAIPFMDNAFYLVWGPLAAIADQFSSAPALIGIFSLYIILFWRSVRHEAFSLENLVRDLKSGSKKAVPPDGNDAFLHALLPADFDPKYYLERYPDVRAAGLDPIKHWLEYGRVEGRIGSPTKVSVSGSTANFNPDLKTIMIVSHEASRTGAPILALNVMQRLQGKYNISCLLLGGGPLTDEFVNLSQVCFRLSQRNDVEIATSRILQQFRPDFALINSAVSHPVIPAFAKASIPTVTLVHEFTTYVKPVSIMEDIIRWSTHLVFSAPIIRDDAMRCLPDWTPTERHHVLPQGQCSTFQPKDTTVTETSFYERGDSENIRTIIGVGSIELRKGVDLFIQCAQQIVKSNPEMDVRFVWVGAQHNPEKDMYSVYLSEQIRRSGLDGRLSFVGETSALDDVYDGADLLLLCSRLDPLPNVGVDAVCRGLPVVCFDSASGIADILQEERLGRFCVAPYADCSAMADLAIQILRNPDVEAVVRADLIVAGRKRFDMDQYVVSLEALLNASLADMAGEEADVRAIVEGGGIDADGHEDLVSKARKYVREGRSGLPRQEAIADSAAAVSYSAGTTGKSSVGTGDFLRAVEPEEPRIIR